MPPAPRPTLFPYTTLFRSYFVELLRHGGEARAQRLTVAHDGAAVESRARVFRRRLDDGGQREDRKSTRLNSSHLGISYAVFGLKKKRESRLTGRQTSGGTS